MACRVQHSIHNTFLFLSSTPLSNSLNPTKSYFKNRINFGKKVFLSSSRTALYCSCSSSNSGNKDSFANGGDEFVLTTPLYYVNAPPHMGSAYTTIAADAIARFQFPLHYLFRIVLPPLLVFRLRPLKQQLEDVLKQNPGFVQPSYRLNEVSKLEYLFGFLSYTLHLIGEAGKDSDEIGFGEILDWGIAVPNDSEQTIYVWFDALLGYVSALLGDNELASLETAISSGWPASLHLIGKDILLFHAVYWLAMLMSAGIGLPKMVFGHGFLTKSSQQTWFRGLDLMQSGIDVKSDLRIINAGNLLNRTLGLLKKNCQSTLAVDSYVAAEGNKLKATVEKLVEKACVHYQNLELSAACETVLEIGNAGNLYIDEQAPWTLFKQGEAAFETAAKDLVIVLEAMRIISIALSPITPGLSLRIYSQLGYTEEQFNAVSWSDTKWGGLKAGQVMAHAMPIFARIEDGTEAETKSAATKKVSKEKAPKSKSPVEA
ncbi:hypothetical protein RND71_025897 [Anisodus tanguticus]|uniref:Methionine--tRNA ligase n=1 Tax=Anisodus tanguticus TaxID=243964 RepID=A0AAE1RMR8_9SOLA|nr:hypothetical protein RND71_025897 [Anisodus tanguticus]